MLGTTPTSLSPAAIAASCGRLRLVPSLLPGALNSRSTLQGGITAHARLPAARGAPVQAAMSPLLIAACTVAAGEAVRRAGNALHDLFCFSPQRLLLEYLPGTDEASPLASRRYTLTHSDLTGQIHLAIGQEFNHHQLSGWYKQLMRDEVLAEWACPADPAGPALACSASLPSLHIYCHLAVSWRVAGEALVLNWPPIPPSLREAVFQNHIPLVLAALAHAEHRQLASSPLLAAAPVFLHLCAPRGDRVVQCGRFGDPASWGAPSPA